MCQVARCFRDANATVSSIVQNANFTTWLRVKIPIA